MTQQSHQQANILRKSQFKKTHAPQCSLQHYLQCLGGGKQPRCSSTDEWVKKMQYIYTMDYLPNHQFSSIAQLYLTLCNPMDCSTPGFPVHHQLPELVQAHVHQVSDAMQPCHLLLPPSSPAFNLFQHQGLFQGVGLTSDGQSIGVSTSASVLTMNIQGYFPLGLTDLILQSKALSRVLSNTTVQKHQFFGAQLSLQSNSQNHT